MLRNGSESRSTLTNTRTAKIVRGLAAERFDIGYDVAILFSVHDELPAITEIDRLALSPSHRKDFTPQIRDDIKLQKTELQLHLSNALDLAQQVSTTGHGVEHGLLFLQTIRKDRRSFLFPHLRRGLSNDED